MRHEKFRAQEHAPEIHGDFPVPFFNVCILYGLVDLDCGIVEQDMHLAKNAERFAYQIPYRFGIGYVGFDRVRFTRHLLDPLRRIERARKVDIGDNHAGAFACKLDCGGTPDAGP